MIVLLNFPRQEHDARNDRNVRQKREPFIEFRGVDGQLNRYRLVQGAIGGSSGMGCQSSSTISLSATGQSQV